MAAQQSEQEVRQLVRELHEWLTFADEHMNHLALVNDHILDHFDVEKIGIEGALDQLATHGWKLVPGTWHVDTSPYGRSNVSALFVKDGAVTVAR